MGRGEDDSTEGLSAAERDAVDITRLLSTLQSGRLPAECTSGEGCSVL